MKKFCDEKEIVMNNIISTATYGAYDQVLQRLDGVFEI